MYHFDPLIRSCSHGISLTWNLSESENYGKLSEKKLQKVCSRFEAIFLGYFFLQMKKTVPESGFLEEGFAQRIYEDELYNILAEKIAEEGKFGIAKMLYRELTSIKQSREGGYYGRSK